MFPALVYRWSAKLTALFWSPLLWAFRPMTHGEQSHQFASRILNLSFYKFSRAYSSGILLLYLVKLSIWIKILEITNSNDNHLGSVLIARFIVPDTILTWHLAAVVNSILTWVIFFRSESYLHDLAHKFSASDESMRKFYQSTFYIRNLLSAYSIFCITYISLSVFTMLPLPPLHVVLVPW